MSPLAGVRVRIVADTVAGHYAAWLLEGLGATVVVDVTSAEGELPRVSQWLLARCVVRSAPVVSPLAEVVDSADIVLVDAGDRLEWHAAEWWLASGESEVANVVVSISPYGWRGPLASRRATPHELQARSGLMAATGDRDGPPLPVGGDVVAMSIGANAVLAALAGWWRRLDRGIGALVEVSGLETVLGLQSSRLVTYTECGLVYRRAPADGLMNFVPCRDGFVNIYLTFTAIEEFIAFLGADFDDVSPEVYAIADKAEQFAAPELLDLVKRRFAAFTRAELVARGVEWRIPVTEALTPADHLDDPHLRARHYYEVVDVAGQPVRVPAHPFTSGLWRSAPKRRSEQPPTPPATSDARLPLAGARVVEFGLAWAAPMATEILAMLGAEVVKVESPNRLDTARVMPLLDLEVRDPWWEFTTNYHPVNSGKLHLGLDIKAPSGSAVLARLLGAADAIVTNFSVRALHELGLDGATVQSVNPRCSVVNATGFGLTGPYRERGAYGSGMEGVIALAGLTGGSFGPIRSPLLHPDISTSLHTCIAVVAALIRRRATGQGTAIDLGQFELGALAAAGHAIEAQLPDDPAPTGDRIRLPCRGDDEWVAVSLAAGEWPVAAHALELEADGVIEPDALVMLADATSTRNKHEVADLLQAVGLAAEPVQFYDEACEEPHLAERGYFMKATTATFGTRLTVGRWHRFVDTDAAPLDGVHRFGADNRHVLSRILGLSDSQIATAFGDGTVGDGPVDAQSPAAGSSPVDWMLAEGVIRRVRPDYAARMGLDDRGR